MIKHIVMWTLKDEAEGATAAENGAKIKQMLDALVAKIGIAKHLEVSMDIFESAPATNLVLYSEFETREDLAAYAVHPEHLECVAFIKKVVSERRVIDYII